jgi:hypothetical protein
MSDVYGKSVVEELLEAQAKIHLEIQKQAIENYERVCKERDYFKQLTNTLDA